MTKPIRLQLSRRKGFSIVLESRAVNGLPVVNVARPSKWGNPFVIGKAGPLGRTAPDNAGAVGFFCAMLDDAELRAAARYPSKGAIFRELKGKNLACWCRRGDPCHADVLLELANGEQR